MISSYLVSNTYVRHCHHIYTYKLNKYLASGSKYCIGDHTTKVGMYSQLVYMNKTVGSPPRSLLNRCMCQNTPNFMCTKTEIQIHNSFVHVWLLNDWGSVARWHKQKHFLLSSVTVLGASCNVWESWLATKCDWLQINADSSLNLF